MRQAWRHLTAGTRLGALNDVSSPESKDGTPTERQVETGGYPGNALRQMLTFIVDRPPPFAQPVPIADGILWLRMPIPYRLNHVNLYLLHEADGFTLID